MKKSIKSVAISIIVVMAFNSCSTGSGAPKVKDNPYLGKALSIFASYEYEQERLREKREKEYNDASSFEELGQVKKTYEKKMGELYSKYAQKAEEESNKIAGTEIPYVIADGLKYTIVGPMTVKKIHISDLTGCGLTVDFNIRIMNNLKYMDKAYLVCMAGDKPLIANMEYFLEHYANKVNIGDVVPVTIGIPLKGDLNNWSDFNLIKFTDSNEWHPIFKNLKN